MVEEEVDVEVLATYVEPSTPGYGAYGTEAASIRIDPSYARVHWSLGNVLRHKGDGRQAHFYSVVSRDTVDTDYAAHRQRFLAEQGYAYRIVDADDLLGPTLPEVG